MMMPLETGLASLAESTRDVRRGDARLEQRLEQVQALLGQELGEVEAALATVVRDGVAPATLAAGHLVELGGKRIRPLAVLASAACFGPVSKAVRELAVAAELVHSATLLHDDVVDEGMLRRGAATARCLWSNGVSVLAGDLLLVHALDRTLRNAPEAMPDLLMTLRRLVDGEVLQLRGRTVLDVSEATYERILLDKTASLFSWCTRTGTRLAGGGEREQELMGSFGERLGIAFQLIDDVLDYTGEHTGKALLTDLVEGKLTLPLVLAVREHPELADLLRRIQSGDPEPVERVSRTVVDSGACEEVRRRARQCTDRALAALRQLPGSAARTVLELVAARMAERAT